MTSSPLAIDGFLPYMRDVARCEQGLRELNLMWRMIESSTRMNCPQEARAILPTIAATREGFQGLEQDLVSSLVQEKVAHVLGEIGTKAGYVIDIVVRNLYERTADVGFLATDHELCAYLAGLTHDRDAVTRRLRAYRSKYTVYDEILLLDTQGNVVAQTDESSPVEGSSDPLIAQTLAQEGYLETFRATDLRPHKRQALVYSRRMRHPDTGAVAGLLCLCFHFEQEMANIFASHRDPEGRYNMLLLDAGNRVIESADPVWIPLGMQVPVNHADAPCICVCAGRQYLVQTRRAGTYQGYPGPAGWQGQVMVPLEVAFSVSHDALLASLDPSLRAGLMTHARAFSAPLYEIMRAAETVHRVVWNGQVMAAGQRGAADKLKTVLDQISETGAHSDALFARSITDLYETVLASSLRQAEFVSHLLVDLLDRNLYERSDDCRWWALTPQLRQALASGPPDADTVARMVGILTTLHGLYTVYTRLFIYDRDGRIVASTLHQADDPAVRGQAVADGMLRQVLALTDEQQYCVTPFEVDPLYGGRPTYTYHAAIRAPQPGGAVVGGIGIVFDAQVELAAMLRGAIPAGQQAYYVDRTGGVIASTDARRPVGSQLALDPALLRLPRGASASRVVVHDGQYAIMGCTVSSGYREFKVSDGYVEDVLAVVFEPLGAVCERSRARALPAIERPDAGEGQGMEYATFVLDGGLFGIPSHQVLEAVSAARVTPVAAAPHPACVGLLDPRGGPSGTAWVFDLRRVMCGQPGGLAPDKQVVLVRQEGGAIGLLVDALHGVPEFLPGQFMPSPFGQSALVHQFIKANQGQLLVQALNMPALMAALGAVAAPVSA